MEEAIRLNPKTNLPMPGYEVVIGITGSYVIDLDASSTITSVAYTVGAKNPLMLYR
jgi:hypothetical protein